MKFTHLTYSKVKEFNHQDVKLGIESWHTNSNQGILDFDVPEQ